MSSVLHRLKGVQEAMSQFGSSGRPEGSVPREACLMSVFLGR